MSRCGTLDAMPSISPRALFEVPPEEYVEHRTRLVREARSAGDRDLARTLGALTKPTLALWAVLAAGADGDAVDRLVGLTATLGAVQAAGDRAATTSATRERRAAIEAMVSAAVGALGAWERSAEARRAEIRGIVDHLSRRPGLADAWRDGTLRDLDDGDPEQEDVFGLGSFGIELRPSTDRPERRPREERTAQVVPLAGRARRTAEDARAEREARVARAARVVAAREARREAAAAESRLGALQRRVDAATDALRDAEAALAAAVAERDEMAARLADARIRLAELGDPDADDRA